MSPEPHVTCGEELSVRSKSVLCIQEMHSLQCQGCASAVGPT